MPKVGLFHQVEEGDLFGSCNRTNDDSNNNDWYVPYELELEKDGVPIDYFNHKIFKYMTH